MPNEVNRAILKGTKILLLIDKRDLTATKRVCALVNCKYHVLKGTYEIPLTYMNVQSLMEWKFLFGKSLRDWERETRHEIENRSVKIKSIDGFNAVLRPFQARGVEFIDECDGRALIADDPGLGKTIQALAWCALHKTERPVLIVCPACVKINWEREIHLRLGNKTKVQVLEGRKPYKIDGEYVIINYDILDWWVQRIKMYGFKVLIADECHFIRNDSSKRTKAFKRIAKHFDRIIALTGTPIENNPIEIFNIVNILNPFIFPNYYQFTHRYCDAKIDEWGRKTVNGATNMEELYRILTKSVMIRRKKSEVLKDLPPKQVAVIPLQLANRAEYNAAERKFLEFLGNKFHEDLNKEGIEKELKAYAKKNDIEISGDLDNDDLMAIKDMKIEKAKAAPMLVQMSILKQLAVKGKMKAFIEWVDDFLESGEKLVVFAINKDVIVELMKKYPDAARYDGSTTKVAKQKAIDRFQNDVSCKLFIANIDAGGIGITLTAASNVAMLQYPWTPGKFAQAPDRVHRMTQTRKVTVWNFVAANTIEEKILKALVLKEKIITDVLDGGKYDPSAIATEVIRMYNKKSA